MDSAVVLRSFPCPVSHLRLERTGMVPTHIVTWLKSSRLPIQVLTFGRKLLSSPTDCKRMVVSCVKTSETTLSAKSDDSHPNGSLEKSHVRTAFPNGFEALVREVCDETDVAELKLKVGDFEMHLKRNIGATIAPMPVVSTATPPPTTAERTIESAPAAPAPSLPKSSEKISPFTNIAKEKSAKLAALEASGSSGYVLVSSPTVGTFRRARTLKGKKQPPSCKEGDTIKEGQVIGFLDQFGTELPVKSDAAGEVFKILFNDGEAVGYGDPLIAVLPSFHSIK